MAQSHRPRPAGPPREPRPFGSRHTPPRDDPRGASRSGRGTVECDPVQIVQSERQLRFGRAPIDDVDHVVDARKLVAFAEPAQHGLGRGPRLGRIEPGTVLHRGGPRPRCRLTSRAGSHHRRRLSQAVRPDAGTSAEHAHRARRTAQDRTHVRSAATSAAATRLHVRLRARGSGGEGHHLPNAFGERPAHRRAGWSEGSKWVRGRSSSHVRPGHVIRRPFEA